MCVSAGVMCACRPYFSSSTFPCPPPLMSVTYPLNISSCRLRSLLHFVSLCPLFVRSLEKLINISPPLHTLLPLSSHVLFAFAYRTHCVVSWLPAKLMSKCHPHATMIQISYFQPSLMQTSHLSVCLSVSHRPSPSSLSLPSSVCCLKLSNEIHTKQDGRPHAFLFLSSASCMFVFLPHSLPLHLPVLIVLSICPSYFLPSSFVLLIPLCGPTFLPFHLLSLLCLSIPPFPLLPIATTFSLGVKNC